MYPTDTRHPGHSPVPLARWVMLTSDTLSAYNDNCERYYEEIVSRSGGKLSAPHTIAARVFPSRSRWVEVF